MAGIDINNDGVLDDINGDGKLNNKDRKYFNSLAPQAQAQLRAMYSLNNVGDTGDDPAISIPSWILSTTQKGTETDLWTKGSIEFGGKTVKGATSARVSELQDLPITWASTAAGKKKLQRLSTLFFGRSDAELNEIHSAWKQALGISSINGQSIIKTIKNPLYKDYFGSAGGGGPQPYRYENVSLTSRKDANDILTQTMIDWLDRAPTEAEKKQFFTLLNKKQNKAPSITKGDGTGKQTTISGGVDATAFARKFVLKKLSPDQDLDGTLGTIQDNLQTLAERNGLFISDKEMLGIMKKIAKGASFESYKAEFNERAALKYTALADALRNNPDATVYDLAGEYIRDMANILEIDPNQITLKDVEKAIAFVGPDGKQRTLAGWEWKKMLRDDPRFQYTTTAKSEASDMATAFARAFGVNL